MVRKSCTGLKFLTRESVHFEKSSLHMCLCSLTLNPFPNNKF